jgi:sialate O-acetylesterase
MVLKPGLNTIRVRALDTGGPGGFHGKPEDMKVELASGGGDSISLSGEWLYQETTPMSKLKPFPRTIATDPNGATVLYNGMIAPLVPFAIKGAIWYQGEANAVRPFQYRTLLPTMIKDWRSRFGNDFPFLIVQLANFMAARPEPSESQWAELREAQFLTSETVPRTAVATAIDIGDDKDIHPKNKQEVGHRLALAARAIAYGEKNEYAGPAFRKMTVESNKIRLTFDHIGGGLVAKNGDKLLGFAIAGSDKKFVWADAVIDGNTVVVSSAQVQHPVAARYDWADNPNGNLYNKANLPTFPFRTDQNK